MIFLPFEKYCISTKLPIAEVRKRLEDSIEPKNDFHLRFRIPRRAFVGEIKKDVFDITRKIEYRNSFTPKVNGVVSEGADRVLVCLRMRMKRTVEVILLLWVVIFSIILLKLFHNADSQQLTILLGMLVSPYVMMMGGFAFESFKAKRLISNLLEAEIVQH